MAYTEEQKAYHLRKMGTQLSRLDYNLDDYISREKFAEYSELTEDEVEQTHHKFMKIANVLKLKPGVRIPIEEAAQQASKVLLSRTSEQRKAIVQDSHNLLFDILDSQNNGCVSYDDFKVYFHVIAPGTVRIGDRSFIQLN